MPLHGENRTYPAYTHVRQIPGGANGLIHLAKHSGWGVDCVQKTYDRPGREDAVAFHEPRLLYSIDHDHIVKILDAQPDGDREHAVTMVMPYYAGGNLHDHAAANRHLSVGQVVEWTGQAADALNYLHVERGLLHRDIKPKNLVLDSGHNLLICDFGSAAALSASGHAAPVRATVQYQPPETAKHGWMTAKSDVYSLGLAAIELLDGVFLWERVDIAAITARVDSGKRGYPDRMLASAARPPHVPAALRTLLSRCVAADPDSRPTAGELATALQRLKFVDWKRVDGDGLDGRWIGAWPPRGRANTSTTLEVTSVVITRGRDAGRRRLVARYSTTRSNGWRSVGTDVSPATVDPQDAAALSKFFNTVTDRVAQRFPH